MAVQILVWPLGFLSNAFAAPGVDAGLAGRDRRVEPAVGDGRRDPRPVRQPGLGRRLVGRDARRASWRCVWPLVLIAVFFPLAVARYRALGR